MTREEAVALLERYSNYDGMGIPNLAGCKEAMKVAVDALKEAFPGLTESEDERIRKRLIEYFEGFRMGNAEVKWEGLNVQEVLVWLEKQKEQKHPNGCFTCDEYKKGYEEGRRNGFTAGYNKAMKEVEQKEQKPVVTHGETYHVDTLGTQQVIAGKMPQKPAEWSDEDKEMLRTVIYDLERHDKDAYATEIKWLKFLDERFSLQTKQEWSEEAEKKMIFLERLIEHNVPNGQYGWVDGMKGGFVTKSEAISFLKSLRPHWKPSEEQMEAFSSYIKDFQEKAEAAVGGWNNFDVMIRLYEQLKKL